VGSECLAEDPFVLGKHVAVAFTKLSEEAGGAFDVCEQQCDRRCTDVHGVK
jgi:hypothetical protein